jgi:hypothetical protein
MGLPLITFVYVPEKDDKDLEAEYNGRRDEQKIAGRPQVSKLYDFYFKNNLYKSDDK